MPGCNGIDTGRRLRVLNKSGEIVFLTSSNDFAADSYDVRAFFYLLKPVEETKLFQVLDRAVKKTETAAKQRHCGDHSGRAQAAAFGSHSLCRTGGPPRALLLH